MWKVDVAPTVRATFRPCLLFDNHSFISMTSLDRNSAVHLINKSADSAENDFDFDAVTNAFRYLRNLCGTNSESQDAIIQDLNILQSTKTILLNILTCESPKQEQTLCLQIGLQFLGNLVVGNKNNQKQLWLNCQNLLEACLKVWDAKIQNISSMILYNVFLGHPDFLNELTHPFEDLYGFTLSESTSEFSVFTLETFVLMSNYILKFYDEIKSENKLILLEIIKNLVTEQNNQTIQPEIVQFFSKQFTKKSDLILKTSESYANSLDPVEVVKILDLLVAFSADDKHYLEIIQQEKSLLINSIELLKNVHSVSKQNNNDFSMITKISEISDDDKMTSIQEHPVFGFKCSLIRLIGNFCWKNPANQNQVRELECIPVLLDCCNIDARNPFIMQWCILAIRNVCERNHENQKVIASLSKEGKIDSARLQELGITLNTGGDGERLCIAPLK